MHTGKLKSRFHAIIEYLVTIVCILLMILLLIVANPSATIDLQNASNKMIQWGEMVVSLALSHLKESQSLI